MYSAVKRIMLRDMEQTTLVALSAFALVSSITPGPNNMMLMASGANFGLRRTIPHALGVGFGFTLMIILVGVGLMGLFDLFPVLGTVLLQMLQNLVNLLGIPSSLNFAVMGSVILIGVLADQQFSKRKKH